MSTYQTILMPLPKQNIPQGSKKDRRRDNRRNNDDINSIIGFIE